MAMVLASTSRITPIIKPETTCSPAMMVPAIWIKLSWKAFSVSVKVSARELSKRVSIFSEISGARLGSSIRRAYHPT